MTRIPAPKCLHEGCQRPTHRLYCFDHQQDAGVAVGTPPVPSTLPKAPAAAAFRRYSSTPELWQDLLGAFPDAGDVVHPHTIRQEALGTLKAAVDAEVYRVFPSLDVADAVQREALVEAQREKMISELLPEVSNVTGAEARELSHSSADVYGRSTEDSRYLASFALNAEWECSKMLNGDQPGDNSSLEQFIHMVSPQMRDTIDIAFRRNLGDFANIIYEVTGRAPLCNEPIAPYLAIVAPPQAPPASAPVQKTAEELADEARAAEVADWFARNKITETPEQPQQQSYPQEQQYQYQNGAPGYQQQAQQEPVPVMDVLKKGIKALDAFIMDEDGTRAAARIVARNNREKAEREARKNRAAEVDLRLKEELLKQREYRNRKNNRWW